MVGSLNRRLERHLYRSLAPKGVRLLAPAPGVLLARLRLIGSDPLTAFPWVVGFTFWGLVAAYGAVSDRVEEYLEINLIPASFFLGFALFWGVFAIVGLLTGYVVLRATLGARLRRFYAKPSCYFCGYELPDLVVTPEGAATVEPTVRCPECGKLCSKVVAERTS